MKKSFSVMVAIVLIASMSVLAFAACVTDDECRHSAMQCIDAVDATCIENGNIEYWYCPDCGKCFSDFAGENEIAFDATVIAATGEHDWGAWVTDSESSCTTGGTRHRVCNVCGERQDETLPVGKHDLNFVKAVEATCTEEGKVAHWHCSECGKNYSDEEATEVLNDVTTPKASHDMTFVEAQAHTCTNDGNVAYWHCGSCDLNYADESGEQELESVVDPAAHTWGEWEQTSDPTCTERGVLTRVCEVCFDEEYDYIDELGHDFEDAQWAYNDANHWHLCNRCGAASQRELHEYDAEGVCVCGMIEYAPTSEFRFISLGGDTWRLANYTGTRRNVSIPSTYNGGTVVAISDNAFAGNTSMETLVIPETVTSIGAEAFADCANLKNLTMSSKVTTIGDNAFDGCDAIETASIPANAASYISKGNLVDLTVTNGAIEEYAFASSPKLASVKVVGETTSIGREAFSGCAVLASVEVNGQEVAIGDNAFVDCAMLTDVAFGDVASIGDFAFKDCAAIGEVVIPDSVTSIGGGAFSGCSGLTSMRLPFVGGSEQVTPSESTLFGYIFGTESYANSFETVQLYGVEEGQSVAYYIPRNLSTVSVGGDIGFGAFYGCDRLVDVTIEESEDVDAYAFYNNIALSHIGIPTSVTHIGEMAFAYCTALEEIEFPGTIMIVDKDAMSESAWYAAQPDGAVYIDKALYGYKGAFPEELQIKDGTYSITTEVFLNAYELKSLIVPSSLTVVQDSAFDGCALTDIVSKMEQISLFPKEAFERVTIIDSTSIPSSAFSGWENLTSVTIPDSVTSIGERAFYDCSGLTSVTIPDSVTGIGYSAFSGCSGLTSVTIGNGVTSIGDRAFSGCSGLTSVTIGGGVTSIGESAFYNCSGLTDVYYQGDMSGWLRIEFGSGNANPMYYADNLYINGELLKGDIVIPEGTKKIGANAFYNCDALTSVTIPDSVTEIGYRAFYGCSGLTSVTIPFVGERADGTGATNFGYIFGASSYSYNDDYVPETLKEVIITGGESIGYRAFYGCSGLTSVTIPDSVASIGEDAFYGCSGLTSITIPGSVTSIGYGVFSGCSGLTSIVVEDGNPVYHSDGNCIIETASKTLIAGCKSSVIPDDGSVTSIGEDAFYECSGLTSVTIPDSVTSIGSYAFYGCSGLTSIIIPFVGQKADGTGATNFGYIFGASSYSSNDDYVPESLKEVIITGGESIDSDAFYGCSGLTSVTIPDSVTSIGGSAFYGCSGLTSITIPDSVTSIGADAFYGCSGLTSITIPDSVTGIGEDAFYGCSGITQTENGVSYVDDWVVGCSSFVTSVQLREGTRGIADYAFSGCSGLTSVTIPDSVTSIGNSAFSNCSGLTSIVIPDSLTSIGYRAFYGCSGLESITIPFVGGSRKTAEDTYQYPFGYIFGTSSYNGGRATKQYYYGSSTTSTTSTTYYIPSTLKSVTVTGGNILYGAFYNCNGLTSVTIGDGVTSIGWSAFYGCSGLTSITIPFVGERADGTGATCFGYIFGASSYSYNDNYVPSSLKEVIITGGANIGDRAFYGCSGLTSVTIGDGVTSIGEDAFYNCSGLTEVYYQGDLSGWLRIEFGSSSANPMCYADNRYINGELLKGEIVIPEGTEKIGAYAFYGCDALTSVTIPDSVTSIGDSAFSRCSGLTSITIPDSVTSIGDGAFSGCSGLTSITIPGSVTSIGESAFSGCSGLTSITIPDSVTSIGASAFYGCSGLTSVMIPDSVTSIGYRAFYRCSGLTSITIPFVGERADGTGATYFDYIFGGVAPDSLKEVIISGGESIDSDAFRGCSRLTSVTIGNGVTSIGKYAFYECSGLTDVYYQGDLSGWLEIEFGDYYANPMYFADNLYINGELLQGDVVIPDGTAKIGAYAFYNYDALTSVTIPDSVTSIGWSAFKGCSGLTSITIPFVGERADGTDETHFGYIFGASSYSSNEDYVPSSLKEVIITGGERIGGSAFSGCSALTNVTIGEGVKSIGNYAFEDCSGLTSVTIPDSVTGIGRYAFYGCSGITKTENGVSYVNDWVVDCDTSVTSVQLREGTRGIADDAFYNCDALTSVTIPDSVTSIGEDAFSGCSGLTDVYYQGNLSGWLRIEFGSSSANPMNYADNLHIADMPKDGVLVIEDGITVIAAYALKGLNELTSVTIPDSVTSIGSSAFEGCSGLTSITIPDSVTSIGMEAFYKCSGLTSITIPDSVTSIGLWAFSGCSGLTDVYYQGDLSGWLRIKFGSSSANPMDYADNLYINGELLQGDIVIPEGTEKIGAYAFYNCDALTSVVIPDSVTSIGADAFYGCSGLTSITIPDSVTGIGEDAFYGCSGITQTENGVSYVDDWVVGCSSFVTSVQLREGTRGIANSAFSNCDALTSVVIPDSVTSIGEYAFFYCSGLTSVTIGNGVTSIGEGAFEGCSGLTSVTIGDGVTSIGADAFYGCSGLTDVYYQGDLSGWSEIEFGSYEANPMYHADNLYINGELLQGEIVIPDGTAKIGTYAFYNCDALTSVTIGSGVTSIGTGAFYYCSGLTSVTIGNGVTSIGSSAFSGCSGLTSVTIGNGVTSIGGWAFDDCSGLTTINFQGTKAQWKAIEKDSYWDNITGEYTVICTDGTISKAYA